MLDNSQDEGGARSDDNDNDTGGARSDDSDNNDEDDDEQHEVLSTTTTKMMNEWRTNKEGTAYTVKRRGGRGATNAQCKQQKAKWGL